MDFTKDTLWELRTEILLGSIKDSDYANSFNLDERIVHNFFNRYEDALSNYLEEHGATNLSGPIYYYDDEDFLWEYYLYIFHKEGEPLCLSKEGLENVVWESFADLYEKCDNYDDYLNGISDCISDLRDVYPSEIEAMESLDERWYDKICQDVEQKLKCR